MKPRYNLKLGSFCATTWCLLLFIGIFFIPVIDSTSNFLALGPSEKIVFAGIRINTWGRWTAVMFYSVLSQIMGSIVLGTLDPFIVNVIRDHKTKNKGSKLIGHLIVQIKTLFDWLNGIFGVYLWITMQLQYLAPALIVDLIITFFITRNYLHNNINNEQLFIDKSSTELEM